MQKQAGEQGEADRNVKRVSGGIWTTFDNAQGFAAGDTVNDTGHRKAATQNNRRLFHGNRLGQVAGLVDVTTTHHGDMIGQQLQGNYR